MLYKDFATQQGNNLAQRGDNLAVQGLFFSGLIMDYAPGHPCTKPCEDDLFWRVSLCP